MAEEFCVTKCDGGGKLPLSKKEETKARAKLPKGAALAIFKYCPGCENCEQTYFFDSNRHVYDDDGICIKCGGRGHLSHQMICHER